MYPESVRCGNRPHHPCPRPERAAGTSSSPRYRSSTGRSKRGSIPIAALRLNLRLEWLQGSRLLNVEQSTLAREAKGGLQPVRCRTGGHSHPRAWRECPAALIEDDA